MTNQQAIEELKQIPFHEKATEKRLKPIYEAIDIAIKALDVTDEPSMDNTMKFMIITTNGTYFIESEDFESAANEVYDTHTGYDDVVGIIKVE